MSEIDKLKRAKLYMDKLSNGVDRIQVCVFMKMILFVIAVL